MCSKGTKQAGLQKEKRQCQRKVKTFSTGKTVVGRPDMRKRNDCTGALFDSEYDGLARVINAIHLRRYGFVSFSQCIFDTNP